MASGTSLPFESQPDFPWIPADENPWNVLVIDLRKVALSMVSTTLDPKIAETFVAFRTGEEYLAVELPIHHRVPGGIRLPTVLAERTGPIAIAAEMEDKWNVYLYQKRLFFARSWTGELVHSATFEERGCSLTITSVETNDAESGETHVVREVDYLIESYVLGNVFPHPLPRSLDRSLEAVLGYSFSKHGRRGLFATYDDTLTATHPAGPVGTR